MILNITMNKMIVKFKLLKSYFDGSSFFKSMTTSLAILVAVTSFSSCGDDSHKNGFKDSKDAVMVYQNYLSQMKQAENLSFEKFSTGVCSWKALDDSVYSFISHDTTTYVHFAPIPEYRLLKDSIKTELFRIADTQKLSFKDVIQFKTSMLSCKMNDVVKKANVHATSFFSSLDTLSTRKGTAPKVLESYKVFLERTEASGINTRAQFLDFLKFEDVLFRSFLIHLHSMNDVSVANITTSTDKICKGIMRKAGSDMISSEDAMIYMTMRSNRRLLQNASVCIADVREGKVKTPVQMTAYYWMILQPFLSIDDFALALLTPDQKQQLNRLAGDAAYTLRILSKELNMEAEMPDKLPVLVLKLE